VIGKILFQLNVDLNPDWIHGTLCSTSKPEVELPPIAVLKKK